MNILDQQFQTPPQLEFLEDKHYYKYNGKFIPSVSSIIRPISASIYKDIDEAVLEQARTRGTAVHFAIELYNSTGAEIIEPEYLGYFIAYLKFREEHPELKLLASELRTANTKLWYAGTIDELYSDNSGNYILSDSKTSYSIERAVLVPQLTGYKEAVEEQHKIMIKETRVLHLKSSGDYSFELIEPDMNTFLSCITINNFIQKMKWRKD